VDDSILANIDKFVAEEHELRSRASQGHPLTDDERARLQDLEERLDQCWDLLRRRRALRESGMNPEDAEDRPISQVESYLQ
jgi:uncharacterized protein DUF2630